MNDSSALMLSLILLLSSVIMTVTAGPAGVAGAAAYALMLIAALACMVGSFVHAHRVQASTVTMLFVAGLAGMVTSIVLLTSMSNDKSSKPPGALASCNALVVVIVLLMRLYAQAPEQFKDWMRGGELAYIEPHELMPPSRKDKEKVKIYTEKYVPDLPTYIWDPPLIADALTEIPSAMSDDNAIKAMLSQK